MSWCIQIFRKIQISHIYQSSHTHKNYLINTYVPWKDVPRVCWLHTTTLLSHSNNTLEVFQRHDCLFQSSNHTHHHSSIHSPPSYSWISSSNNHNPVLLQKRDFCNNKNTPENPREDLHIIQELTLESFSQESFDDYPSYYPSSFLSKVIPLLEDKSKHTLVIPNHLVEFVQFQDDLEYSHNEVFRLNSCLHDI